MLTASRPATTLHRDPVAGAAPPRDRSISDVVRQLNQSLELERVVTLVAQHALELLGAVHASVLLVEGEALVMAGGAGDFVSPTGTRVALRPSLAGDAIRAGRPLRTTALPGELSRLPVMAAGDALPTGGNAIAAPMVVGEREVGVIGVVVTARPIDDADERLLAKLAGHAAVAVENARLFADAARTARHAHILAETSRELARRVSPAALYEGVGTVATTLLGAAGACVFLADAGTRHVEIAFCTGCCTGAVPHDLDDVVRHFWPGALGATVASGAPAFLDAPTANAVCTLGSCAPDTPTGAAALLPLVVEGRARGVLVLRFAGAQRFEPDERRLLTDFATQVAVAHRNAMLVSALEQRAARLAAVAQLQQALPQADLASVYTELHRAVRSVVDAPCFALFTTPDRGEAARDPAGDAGDADEPEDVTAAALVPRIVVIDGRVVPPESLGPCPARDRLTTAALATGRVVYEPHPVWSLGAAAAPEPGREWRAAAAGLAAPVLHGSRVLGVLHAQSYAPGAYGPEDVDLVEIIARQAGAAVELARAFDARRQEQELAEASAEVARIALAADGVREAAAPILGALQRLVPQLGVALAVRVDGGQSLEYLAASPSLAHVVGRSAPFEESLARHLISTSPTFVPDVREATAPERRHLAPAVGALIVPLVARQRMIGFLAVAQPLGAGPSAATADLLRRLAAPAALAVDGLLRAGEERTRTERERMLATALATMDQPVLVLSTDDRVCYANSAAVREYGWSLDELVGMPLDQLVRAVQDVGHGTPGPAWPADEAAAQVRSVRVAQQVHRRRDGSEFPAAVTHGTIRDAAGTRVGRVLGVRGLTEERRVAEQLRQHEKLAALGSLVAGVAHELNNPLTGISAFSQLLLEDELPDEQRESVRLIKREADRAVGVIRDLLLFARKGDARLGPVDVNALLHLAVRLRAYTLRADDVAVALELDPDAPAVLGDEQRLQQVLLNLIVNAEYALHGQPERRLTLRSRRLDGHLVIEVADSGAGIDAGTQRHIFEPFFTTKPAGVGTGLGLSVSYGIVQAHGGTITVDSAVGRGTTFRITLPPHPSVHRSESA